MKAFEFIEGSLPRGFRPDYISFLYNENRHRVLQSKSGWHSYYIVRKDKKTVYAEAHFCCVDQVAHSPFRAPFGSITFSEVLPVEQLYNFISFVEGHLKKTGAQRIIIKNYPEIYSPISHNVLTVLFFNHNFKISNAELDACISIDDSEFESKLETWEKRRLKQAEKAELKFNTVPQKQLSKFYHFILQCREERGQSLSMDFKSLQKTVNAFPAEFILFGVYRNSSLVAASICIRVNQEIIYNFYSAHSKSSDSLSPVVFMFEGIYNWCRKQSVTLLDLGTSALGGKPNFSLIDFKLRVGGIPTMKLTFEKDLA